MLQKKIIPPLIAAAILCQSCATVTAAASSVPVWKVASWCCLKLSSFLNEKANEEEKANNEAM